MTKAHWFQAAIATAVLTIGSIVLIVQGDSAAAPGQTMLAPLRPSNVEILFSGLSIVVLFLFLWAVLALYSAWKQGHWARAQRSAR